jgi:hypothetical protein
MAASSRVKMKVTAVREPAARVAGGTPALHCLARKTWERGRLARFVGLALLRVRDNEPCPESLGFAAQTDLDGALSFHTKLQSNHRETPKMTEILTPRT